MNKAVRLQDFKMVNLFEEIKARLYLPEVAKFYGMEIDNKNKAICPFHDDHHPSLSFKNNKFKCFVCQTGGTVIDFVMNYFGLTAMQAAQKLNDDFNMGLIKSNLNTKDRQKIQKMHAKRKEINAIIETFKTWKETTGKWFLRVFRAFRKIFRDFAPKKPKQVSKIFIIAANYLEHISYILDFFLSSSQEKLLEEYNAIESWKHKILKELEVF